MEMILKFDDKVMRFVNKNLRNKTIDRIMRFITALGDNGAVWIGIAFCLMMLGGKKRKAGWLMLLSLGVEAAACNLVIKPTVARIRPNDKHDFKLTIKKPKDYSEKSIRDLLNGKTSTKAKQKPKIPENEYKNLEDDREQ